MTARTECPEAGCPALRPCPEHGPAQGSLDAHRAGVLAAFVEEVAAELSGCCTECDACIQIMRRIAEDEVAS